MGFLDIKKELINLAFDPNQVQVDLYKYMENLLEGNDIPDPTNPFMFLLESNATVGSLLLEQMKINLRKLYPTLAKNREDLYHHLYGREIDNIFAYPSLGSFNISIPVKDIVNYGENKGTHYELVIPSFTRIIVKDFYTFMFLNDVVIRYFPNTQKTLVLYMPSELSIGFMGDEILDSYLITDNNNIDWVMFSVTLKQVDGIYLKEPIIPTNGYNKDIELKDQFYTIFGKIKSPTVGQLDLIPVFSDFVYDVKKPILKCILKDNNLLNVSLYDVYLENSDFNQIELLAFNTKGKLSTSFINIDKSDFVMDFNLVKDIKSQIGSVVNITPVIYSNSFINGGRNMLSVEELKDIIINNTTGDNKLPITNYDLKRRANDLGYKLLENMDSILKREYVVYKDLPYEEESFLYANPDIFLDTLELKPTDIVNLPDKIKMTDSYLVIEPFTFFYKDNYVFKPVEQSLVNKLKSSSLEDLSDLLKDKKYFYNIYKYVCDFKDIIDYRIYEVNNPKITYIRSIYYNRNLTFNLTYSNSVIKRVNNQYKVILYLNLDDNIKNLIDNNFVKSFIKFKPGKGSSDIFIDGVFNTKENTLTFTFDLDSYIDPDDKSIIRNFSSVLDIVKIDNNIDATIYIYSIKNLNTDNNTTFLDDVLKFDTSATDVISVFNTNLLFYERLEYLYSNYKITPTLRLYKRYDKDIYATYKENVYAKDKDGNYIFETVELNGQEVKQLKILHRKGDIIKDKNGNPIVLHHKGDVMLDENGKPIIDYQNGYDHYIDILTFELEFLLTKDQNYTTYMVSKYLELDNYLLNELKQLNSEVLENTKILFKPKHNLKDVKVYKNNTVFSTPAFISPTVILYIIEDINDNKKYSELVRKLNILLQQAFKLYNNRVDMVKYILDNLNYPNIQYIRIDNIDTIGELNLYNYLPDSNRFILNKKLSVNVSGSFVPQIDFKLEIVKV